MTAPNPSPVHGQSSGELDLLRAYLRERDVACPACKHNLRGTAHFACPECGARLDLRVTSMDVPHRWWVVSLLAFAVPLGLFGSLAGAGAWAMLHGRLLDEERWALGGCWAGLLLTLVGLALSARGRVRFIQKTAWRQRAWAGAWVIAALASMLAIMHALTSALDYW
jgi:hypothetical protein